MESAAFAAYEAALDQSRIAEDRHRAANLTLMKLLCQEIQKNKSGNVDLPLTDVCVAQQVHGGGVVAREAPAEEEACIAAEVQPRQENHEQDPRVKLEQLPDLLATAAAITFVVEPNTPSTRNATKRRSQNRRSGEQSRKQARCSPPHAAAQHLNACRLKAIIAGHMRELMTQHTRSERDVTEFADRAVQEILLQGVIE